MPADAERVGVVARVLASRARATARTSAAPMDAGRALLRSPAGPAHAARRADRRWRTATRALRAAPGAPDDRPRIVSAETRVGHQARAGAYRLIARSVRAWQPPGPPVDTLQELSLAWRPLAPHRDGARFSRCSASDRRNCSSSSWWRCSCSDRSDCPRSPERSAKAWPSSAAPPPTSPARSTTRASCSSRKRARRAGARRESRAEAGAEDVLAHRRRAKPGTAGSPKRLQSGRPRPPTSPTRRNRRPTARPKA